MTLFRALLIPACLVATACSPLFVEAGEVSAKKQDDSVRIEVDGEHFTTFQFADEQNKPYFHPVFAEGGTLVVREDVFGKEGENRKEPGRDHFHHKGIWIAIDSINDDALNTWHERNKIRTDSVKVDDSGDNVVLKVNASWLDDDGQPLLKEKTTYTITPDRLIACELQLTAVDRPVTFGDTKEGLFAIRVHTNLRGAATGTISNADGLVSENDCWGKPSAWVDYTGKVDGKTVGVTIFDDENNFRPSRYHVRGYGLFAINPFGEKSYSKGQEEAKPLTLKPGEAVNLRYGLYVHASDKDSANIEKVHKAFKALGK